MSKKTEQEKYKDEEELMMLIHFIHRSCQANQAVDTLLENHTFGKMNLGCPMCAIFPW